MDLISKRHFPTCAFVFAFIFLGILVPVLTACTEKQVESVVIYITATPSPEERSVAFEAASDSRGEELNTVQYVEIAASPDLGEAEAVFAVTGTPLPPFPTSTPSITPIYSPTPLPTATLAGSPTATLLPLNLLVPPSEELPVLDGLRMGAQVHPFIDLEEWNYTLLKMIDMGFEWIKIQIPWDLMEPSPGQYNTLFYAYQLQLGKTGYQLNHAPFLVMISISNAPAWARPPGADLNVHGPPADPYTLANFIRAFLADFNPQDRVVDAIEIWNEPNLDREWNGLPISGVKYMELFRASYDAIKQIDPTIVAITAGLAPVGEGLLGAVSDRVYLQQMYDAGLAQYPDVKVGAHPYGWGNPPDDTCCTSERGWAENRVFYFKDTLEDYSAIIQRNGHQTKIWVTEFGWGTMEGVTGDDRIVRPPEDALFFDLVTAQQQSQYTVRAFEIMQTPPLGDMVEVAILWNMNFASVVDFESTHDQRAGYSVLDTNKNPRLLFYYLVAPQKIQHSPSN